MIVDCAVGYELIVNDGSDSPAAIVDITSSDARAVWRWAVWPNVNRSIMLMLAAPCPNPPNSDFHFDAESWQVVTAYPAVSLA